MIRFHKLLITCCLPCFAALAMVEPCGAEVQIARGSYLDRDHFIIRTSTTVWYYDCAGGGFSRLIDREGTDWIDFRNDPLDEFPASAAAGYRGIPNAVFVGPDRGAGHPGFDRCESEILGANKIRSVSRSGKWSWTWSFEESAATFTMEKADPEVKWWFLYEGPIAGSFDPQKKFWGTDSLGRRGDAPDRRSQLFARWRWLYVGDRDVPRVLFLYQHQPDELPDTYWHLGASDGGATESGDGMVVVGFGRGRNTTPQFTGPGIRMTVGWIEMPGGERLAHQAIGRAISESVSSGGVERH